MSVFLSINTGGEGYPILRSQVPSPASGPRSLGGGVSKPLVSGLFFLGGVPQSGDTPQPEGQGYIPQPGLGHPHLGLGYAPPPPSARTVVPPPLPTPPSAGQAMDRLCCCWYASCVFTEDFLVQIEKKISPFKDYCNLCILPRKLT